MCFNFFGTFSVIYSCKHLELYASYADYLTTAFMQKQHHIQSIKYALDNTYGMFFNTLKYGT